MWRWELGPRSAEACFASVPVWAHTKGSAIMTTSFLGAAHHVTAEIHGWHFGDKLVFSHDNIK